MTMVLAKLMRVKTLITGQINRVNTEKLGQTKQWTTWNQNLMIPMREATILGYLVMMRRPFLKKSCPIFRQTQPSQKPQKPHQLDSWKNVYPMPDPHKYVRHNHRSG